MSIIHDALKKVQQTSNPGPAAPLAPYQEPVQPPEQPKPQDKINIPLLVAALCAVIAMIFAVLPHITPKKAAVPPSPAVTAQASAVTSQVPAAPEKKLAEPKPAAASPETPSSGAVSKAVANAMAAPVMPALKPPVQKIVDPNDPLSSIHIEGIMDMNGKKAVLISGNVYEEGQTIYGRIISEITFDRLTIIENGQKRIFAIKP